MITIALLSYRATCLIRSRLHIFRISYNVVFNVNVSVLVDTLLLTKDDKDNRLTFFVSKCVDLDTSKTLEANVSWLQSSSTFEESSYSHFVTIFGHIYNIPMTFQLAMRNMTTITTVSWWTVWTTMILISVIIQSSFIWEVDLLLECIEVI